MTGPSAASNDEVEAEMKKVSGSRRAVRALALLIMGGFGILPALESSESVAAPGAARASSEGEKLIQRVCTLVPQCGNQESMAKALLALPLLKEAKDPVIQSVLASKGKLPITKLDEVVRHLGKKLRDSSAKNKRFSLDVNIDAAGREVALELAAELNPHAVAKAVVTANLCRSKSCSKEADAVLHTCSFLAQKTSSRPVTEPLPKQMANVTQNRRGAGSYLAQRTAWICLAELEYRTALGLEGATDLAYASIKKAALLMAQGAARSAPVDKIGPLKCKGSSASTAALFQCTQPPGGATPPSTPGGPAPIDPVNGAAMSGGAMGPGGIAQGVTNTVPSEYLPGACYGIDPMKLYGGGISDDDPGSAGGTSPPTGTGGGTPPAGTGTTGGGTPPAGTGTTGGGTPPAGTGGGGTSGGPITGPNVGPADTGIKLPLGLKDINTDKGLDFGSWNINGGAFGQGGKLPGGGGSPIGDGGWVGGGVSWMPTPDSDTAPSACGQSFSMAMAACLTAFGSEQSNVSCGSGIQSSTGSGANPLAMPDPDHAQSMQCGCKAKNGGGSPGGSSSTRSSTDTGSAGSTKKKGAQKCCPALCTVADEGAGSMCSQCGGGTPSCAGGGSADLSKLGFCGAFGNDPRFVKLCGMIDPAPFMAMKAASTMGAKFNKPTQANQQKTADPFTKKSGASSSKP